MVISLAAHEHATAISELVFSAAQELRGIDFTEEGWSRFLTANTVTEIERKLQNHEFLVFCYIESNRLLGFISIKDAEKIDQLFVLPEARKQCIATSLWTFAKSEALTKGASGNFWVRSSRIAVPFYKKFGFSPEGDTQILSGIRFQLMRLATN